MSPPSEAWEQRLAALWRSLDELDHRTFLDQIDQLTSELPPGNPVALFEQAGARDSTGYTDLAVPLYRQALQLGLDGERRRRAVIQLASSLRALGQVTESVALLTAEQAAGSDHLDDAVQAFLALALLDAGRERGAVSAALVALAPHLPRYQRSVTRYALALAEPPSA
ncbi:tetratricopeptide repeat protein [Deinococcus hohokamensis]|uniref:Tetratricopeptide repeat protein n=1 Tax=Deinococcus hohokamensis TaxID=309883 RepID=A0ABV9I9V7_9DEIO